MSDRIAVVDQENRFLRWTDREEIHTKRLPHRSVHVLVFNRAGELLLQQRSASKDTYPEYWDVSCSGHVEESDYIEGPDDKLELVHRLSAARELQEELGVEASLKRIGNFAPEPGVHYEHFVLYETRCEGPFTMQEEEVSALRFLSANDYDRMRVDAQEALTPSLCHLVEWLRAQGRYLPR